MREKACTIAEVRSAASLSSDSALGVTPGRDGSAPAELAEAEGAGVVEGSCRNSALTRDSEGPPAGVCNAPPACWSSFCVRVCASRERVCVQVGFWSQRLA